jgi:hypothetical protein
MSPLGPSLHVGGRAAPTTTIESHAAIPASATASIRLAHTQFVIARELGLQTWGDLRFHIVAQAADRGVFDFMASVAMRPGNVTRGWRHSHDIVIAGQLTGLFAAVSFREVVGTVTDIMVSGELGVETGTYSWTIAPASGTPAPDVGKYMHVWKRQGNGTWKVVRYVVNSDTSA